MEDKFSCKECKLTELSVNDFSKSQINKLNHDKISKFELKCCKCVEKEHYVELQHKYLRKLQLTDGKITESTKNSKNNERSTSIQKDPSLTYIRNPLVTPITNEFLTFFKSNGFEAMIHIGPIFGWRTVAKLAVRASDNFYDSTVGTNNKNKTKKSNVNIGLFRPGTHDVLDCNDSPVHHPSINLMLRIIRSACNRCEIPAFHEETQTGLLRYVLFGVEICSTKVQVTFVWNTTSDLNSGEKSEKILSLLAITIQQLDTHRLLQSLWVHYHPAVRHVNAITGRDEGSWRMLIGNTPIIERIEVGMSPILGYDKNTLPGLRFPPNVFRQANIIGFSKIIKEIRKWIPNGASCMELYGGVGTIGLNCIDLVSSLQCSDENPYNKICFEETVSELPEPWRCKAKYRSLSAADMVKVDNLMQYDVILVDPPRKGLEEEVITALLESTCKTQRKEGGYGTNDSSCNNNSNNNSNTKSTIRLIYVSCGFKAFQRDMKSLIPLHTTGNTTSTTSTTSKKRKRSDIIQSQDDSWRLLHVEGHVLFPGSDHVETLAVFEKNRSST